MYSPSSTPQYCYSREQAEIELAKKGLSPDDVAKSVGSSPLKEVAKECGIGYTRFLAILTALGLRSTKQDGYEKSSRKKKASMSERVDVLVNREGVEPLSQRVKEMTEKDFCERYGVTKSLYRRVCEHLGVESAPSESPSTKAARRRLESNCESHGDVIEQMITPSSSYAEMAEMTGLSSRQVRKVCQAIDPTYSPSARNWFTRHPEEAEALKKQRLSDASHLVYGSLLSPTVALSKVGLGTHTSVEDKASLYEEDGDDSILSWMSRRRESVISEEVSDFLERFNVNVPDRFGHHPSLYSAYCVTHDAHLLRQAIGCFPTLDAFYEFFSELGRNALIEHLPKIVDDPTKCLPERVDAATKTANEIISDFGEDRVRDIISHSRNRAQVEREFGINYQYANVLYRKLGMKPMFRMSKFESQVADVLESLETDFVFGKRGVLENGRAELDFYIPSLRIAIEVNPTHTHNSLYGWGYNPELARDKNYHRSKFLMCERAGIKLISLYEKDLTDPNWTNVTKPFLTFLVKGAARVFYAREVEINELTREKDKRKARAFFSRFHFQGNVPAQYYYSVTARKGGGVLGFFSFGKPNGSTHGSKTCELKRMAFVPDVQVRFALSKMVKRFFRDHDDIDSIISYSRNDMGTGNAYRSAGFDYIRESLPTPVFINPRNPYDSYSWAVATSWSAKEGVISRQVGASAMSNSEAFDFVCRHLQHRNDSGVGYVPVYGAGSRLWKIHRQ